METITVAICDSQWIFDVNYAQGFQNQPLAISSGNTFNHFMVSK